MQFKRIMEIEGAISREQISRSSWCCSSTRPSWRPRKRNCRWWWQEYLGPALRPAGMTFTPDGRLIVPNATAAFASGTCPRAQPVDPKDVPAR